MVNAQDLTWFIENVNGSLEETERTSASMDRTDHDALDAHFGEIEADTGKATNQALRPDDDEDG